MPTAYLLHIRKRLTIIKRECVHSAYIINVKHVEYPSQEINHFTCQFQCLQKKLSLSLYHQLRNIPA